MAVVSMRKLSICASNKNRKGILETLQSMGAIQVECDSIDDPDLKKKDTKTASAQYEKSAESFDQILKLLDAYAPEKGVGMRALAGKEAVSPEEVERVRNARTVYLRDSSDILKKDKEISELRGRIIKDRNMLASIEPWMGLDIPMDQTGTKKTTVFTGVIPEAVGADELYAAASSGLPEPVCLTADVISTSGEMTCVTVICLTKDREKVEENLRGIGFSKPSQAVKGIPADRAAEYEDDIKKTEQRIEALKSEIASYADKREDYRIAADYYRTRAAKYKVLGTLPQSEHAFFLEGWIPEKLAKPVAKVLEEKYDAIVDVEEPAPGEEAPTLLSNNRFSQTVEGVLSSYGLPTKGHVDPTFVMSIFYVIFFGMMLSDAGYGIVMFIGCAIVLKKFPKIDAGLRKMIQLFFWCGLSTTFWGFMYGGFFGDAIDTVARTFFGYTGSGILKPLWFEPLKDPMRLLIWCMLFGLIHLFVGLGMKGYEYIMNGDPVGLISDVISWYLFIIGLVLMLIPSDIFSSISGSKITFPPFVGALAKALALTGVLIILVMSGRRKKNNWPLRLALGAYDVYGVTGWLSDVLSYSRLLALGLATGVIANVINMMAGMVGKGFLGPVLFALVFVLGHTLNIAINALGAYVHTNRLQFVEFFGKFYDGGGKVFTPFKTVNQYIEIKEEK